MQSQGFDVKTDAIFHWQNHINDISTKSSTGEALMFERINFWVFSPTYELFFTLGQKILIQIIDL